MTRTSLERLKAKDHAAFLAAAVCAVVSILIWMLWVLPVAGSIDDARPVPIGRTIAVDLSEGQTVGIWASGRSAALGSMDCTVTDVHGSEVPQSGGSSLRWDDVLWWMTPRRGFEQHSQITASEAGEYVVRCEDSLDTYDGEFLVAGDSFGTGDVGLGRTGGSDYSIGAILVFCAVLCPPVAVLIPAVILLRRLFTRRGRMPR